MTWLSTKEAAELLGFEKSTIGKKVRNKEYQSRKVPGIGRGGETMEILLESLPEQAQKAYHNQVNGDSQFVINTDYTSTKAQKEKGELKRLAVAKWNRFTKDMKKEGVSKGKSTELFITGWNEEHDDLYISSSKVLYDWKKQLQKGESLIDKRGGYNRGQSSIPKDYQEYFLSRYLQQSKPPFDVCFRLTQIEANKNGVVIPGKKAFRNLLKNTNEAIIARAREGKKYFEDNFMPTMQRDYSALLPNDIWVADHHLWDIFVRIPNGKGGWRPIRPWGSYWMDMRTRKVMIGFIREESPNSDIVLLSFGIAVKNHGIPRNVYMDNGKDYKARDLFYPEGHISKQDKQSLNIAQNGMSEEEVTKSCNSIAKCLQMDSVYAIPRNARAKPIERLFNTLENGFGKLYPSYAGSDAKSRPEDLKDLDIMKMVTLEEFIKQHNLYIEEIYNNSPHSGDSMDNKSPNYWYENLGFKKRTMSDEALYFTLMRTSKPLKIGKEGIRFNKELYINAEFQNHIHKEVFVRYNPTEPKTIYVYDMNENFLFIAKRREKYGFELTAEDYERANSEKKLARNAMLNGYKPNLEVRSTETIGRCLEDYANSMEKTDGSEPKVIEPIRNEKIEETVRRYHSTSLDRNYEDVLKACQKIKKDANDRQKELADKFKKKMLDRAYENQA